MNHMQHKKLWTRTPLGDRCPKGYNKIFGTKLSGDVEGGLSVALGGGELRIFSSGEVVCWEQANGQMVSYPTVYVDKLKQELTENNLLPKE